MGKATINIILQLDNLEFQIIIETALKEEGGYESVQKLRITTKSK